MIESPRAFLEALFRSYEADSYAKMAATIQVRGL